VVLISKALLLGVVALGFAGTAALISSEDSDAVADGRWLRDGSPEGTSFESSRARAASDGNMAADTSFWYYYSQNRPGCPASACSFAAMFQFAR
jgi:hypothetical protein